MKIEEVYVGGWFQRTTLHLSEIFEFFKGGTNHYDPLKESLEKQFHLLNLINVIRVNGPLEYLEAQNNNQFNIRVYEDGLILLHSDADRPVKEIISSMGEYYDDVLSPSLSLLFSKGAPVPKELAQMTSLLPFVLVTRDMNEMEAKNTFEELGVKSYTTLKSGKAIVYQSKRFVIIATRENSEKTRKLVEGQIFFREFKDQLHRYLTIHRIIWDEIAEIKERGYIKGKDVKPFRAKLDEYQKTVKLIESRINQMSSYLKTRGKIYSMGTNKELDDLFLYKFETLEDTLMYIKDLWKMTDNYLNMTLQRFVEIQNESTKNSISSLRLVTTLGVVAALIGYIGRQDLPNATYIGIGFLVALIFLTWFFNEMVALYYARKKYVLHKDKNFKADKNDSLY